MVVVVLWGGVVVVMVVRVGLDVPVGKEERSCGRWRLLSGRYAGCQGPVALDGAVPAGCPQLRSCGEEAKERTASVR